MLSKIFSSNKRIQVLEHVLYQDTATVSTVVKELSLSKGFVSEFLHLLYQNNILEKNKGYHLTNTPLTKAIKILLNVNKIKLSKIKKPYMKGIGLYGSWANGSNTMKSDLDLWIKTEKYPDEKELAYLSKNLREMTHSDIQLLVLTPQKLEQIKKDTPFYISLRYNSLLLWGEPIE
ncbi:MAG: nucleotidyltransferase domain-containing protein [Euryarchaeota archaeon]|nr:nucleotidyltransferase domain-containing protein [Euryarchaeota archaeon]